MKQYYFIGTNHLKSIVNFTANNGPPKYILTDNGAPFKSKYTLNFLKKNNIYVIDSSPRHPQSRGIVENAIGRIRQSFRNLNTDEHIFQNLPQIIRMLNKIPFKSAKMSPHELFYGTKSHLWNNFDFLESDDKSKSLQEIINSRDEDKISISQLEFRSEGGIKTTLANPKFDANSKISKSGNLNG